MRFEVLRNAIAGAIWSLAIQEDLAGLWAAQDLAGLMRAMAAGGYWDLICSDWVTDAMLVLGYTQAEIDEHFEKAWYTSLSPVAKAELDEAIGE